MSVFAFTGMHIGRNVLVFSLICVLAACKSQPPNYGPVAPAAQVTLKYLNTGTDAHCAACNSDLTNQGVYLHNDDTANSWFVKTEITARVASSPPSTLSRADTVPPSSDLWISCTTVSSTSPILTCNQQNKFAITDESKLTSSDAIPATPNLPEGFVTNSPQACTALCQFSASCYQIGVQGAGLALPFLALIDAAGSNSQISKAELLQKYNMKPSDDQCNRGDVFVANGVISNTGTQDMDCIATLSAASGVTLPDDMAMHIPPLLVGTPQSASRLLGAVASRTTDGIIQFTDLRTGPAVVFPAAASGDFLTNLYGGSIRSATRLGDQLILSTSHGCIGIQLGVSSK